jgi:hypothetical protein
MVLTDSDRIPRVPPYSGYCYQWIAIRVRDYHPLWSYFPVCSTLQSSRISQPYNPKFAETNLVWAFSTSLAATTEITIVFFSCAYLDVSVQRVRPIKWWHVFNMPGFPIQISTDQIVFANPRSFSQLITSFFASESLGIPCVPLVTYYYL